MFKGILHTIIAAILFGTIGIFVKLIGTDIPIQTTIFFRVFIAFLTLMILCPLVDPAALRPKRSDWKHFALIGLLMALSNGLYTAANQLTTIANAILLDSMFMFLVIPIAAFFLKERITRTQIISMIIAFAGLLIINPLSSGDALGNLLALLAALCFALLIVYMRYEGKTHTIGTVFWFFLFASLFLSPLPFIYGLGDISGNIQWLFGLGIIASGLGYFSLNRAMRHISSETSSLVLFIVNPFAAIVFGAVILDETISANTLYGGAVLLLAGAYLGKHLFAVSAKKEAEIHHKYAIISGRPPREASKFMSFARKILRQK